VHYLYPSTTTFALIDRIADSPLFHTYYDMPIQHIDDRMLKTMKRGFGETKTRALLEHMRSKPDAFIRTSVIAGHPGEERETFAKLVHFMKDFGFDRFNTFHYSNEEDTMAYTMEQIPQETIDQQAESLGKIAQESTLRALEALVGQTVTAALDGESDEHEYLLSARPLQWAVEIDGEILVNDTNDLPVQFGKSYKIKITGMAGHQLLATLVEQV
jgi:tRNA A37 methylthiotransferase MiaB